jgi:acetyl-CoA carboxylase, biotin carboxylase subunit
MGKTALKIVELSGYSNAGTVEFLLDKKGNFYFLEVNARLQVEHPVTELVCGIDLVHAQFRIAAGEKLWLKQENIRQRGHAIECRIYAENPENNFLPSAGKILFMKEPSGPGIRHDCGIYSGCEVSVYYDPILSKLIAWAPNREICCHRMAAALSDFPILGIKTDIEFLHDILIHPEFLAGNTFTDFITQNMQYWSSPIESLSINEALLAAAYYEQSKKKQSKISDRSKQLESPWETLGDWQIGSITG